MIVCWVIHCVGLLDPLYWFIRVYKLDTLGVSCIVWVLIYAVVVVGIGIAVGRGIYLRQRWARVSSLTSTALAVMMIHPFYILFCLLVYLSPYTRQFDGPGDLFTILSYGLPVAISALPYLVIRSITLTDTERRKVSALNDAIDEPTKLN